MMKKFAEVMFILAMLIPFAPKLDWTYYYWITIATAYLIYITVSRWEYE